MTEIAARSASATQAGKSTVWRSRALLRALVVRNLKMRYKRSLLGFLWALLNPLLTVVILVGVFRFVFHVTVKDYWALLVSGYFAWVFVLHTVSASAGVIREHAYMTRTLAFPSDVLVLSTVLGRFVEFVAELAIVAIVIAVVRHHGVPLSYLALPLVLVLHAMITLAFSYPIAALSIFFNDVQHALPVGLTLLGYLSPIYYPLSLVPEPWLRVYRLNPFATVIPMFHEVLYDGVFPSIGEVVLATAFAVALLYIGRRLFRWKRAFFAEVV